MASKEELKKLLKKEHIYSVLNEHHEVDELISFLEIMKDNDSYYDADSVLKRFPKSSLYDKYKTAIIDASAPTDKDNLIVSGLIKLIVDDDTKLEYLEKYRSKFENYQIADIINSLQNDELRKEIFRQNIDIYDDDSFSDYLRNIKSDELRMKEFLLYKNKYPNYNLLWFAGSFKTDEDKMAVFDKYYDDTTVKNTAFFEGYLENKENKLKFIEKYIDKLTPSDVGYFNFSVFDQDTILYLLNKYKEKMNCDTITKLLMKINDEEKRISLLDELIDYLTPSYIMDIISKINDIDRRIEVFDKYKDLFEYRELRTMLIYLDEKHSSKFLDKYIDYFSGELLAEIWARPYFFCCITMPQDEFLNKYIDRINTLGFSMMMEKLQEDYHDYNSIIQFLLGKVNNKTTIRRLLNSIAFEDKDYFLKYLFDNNAFTQEERDLCNELSGGNTNFYSSFLFELFDIPSLKNNRYFLTKLAKYPELSQKIVDLYHKKPNIINLLLLLIKRIYSYDIYYDNLISSLINALSTGKNSYINNIVMSELTEERKIVLIYKLINNDRLVVDEKIKNTNDLDSYLERSNNRINELYLSSSDLKEKKNLLFNKIFGFSIEKADNIVNKYGFSLDKLGNEKEIGYVRLIKDILEEKNTDNIDHYYQTLEVLDLEERLLLEENLKKLFTKGIRDSLYKISDNKPIRSSYFIGDNIPVYKPTNDFCLLVNSLSAYRSRESIDDYDAFWNNNSNIKNHGICCSLISNQNIAQTAPIHDVIVGFDGFSDNAIQLADSTDIFSLNDNFDLSAIHKSRFMTPQDYIDETRHTHNELVIERRELRKDINSINIKPSYIVIYDFFEPEKIEKSIKAAKELNVPIVYIDTLEIAEREKNIVNRYFDEIIDNYDMNLFNKFLVRYLNNANGFVNNCNYIKKALFDEKELSVKMDELFASINDAYTSKRIDKETVSQLYEEIIKILQNENIKCEHQRTKVIDIESLIAKARKKFDKIVKKEQKITK